MLEQFSTAKKEAPTSTVESAVITSLSADDKAAFDQVGALLEAPNTEAFDKALERQDFRRKVKKLLVYGMTMLAPLLAKANTTEHTNTDFETPQTITQSDQDSTQAISPETISYEAAKGLDTEPDPEHDTLERIEKTVDAGFSMGKATLNPEQRKAIAKEFTSFLEALPEAVKDKINTGALKIVVTGSTSFHPIDPETGTYTGERGYVYDNETLAQYRGALGVEILQEDILKHIDTIETATIAVQTHVYDQQAGADELEQGRRLRISIEEVLEGEAASEVLGFSNPELLQEFPKGTIEFIINDASDSNKGHAGELFELAKAHGYIDGKVDLYVGTTALDVAEKVAVTHGAGADNMTKSIQQQHRFSNNEDMVGVSARVLRDRPMVQYKDRIEGETGIGVIVTDEAIAISRAQLEELKSQQGHRDVQLVYMIADRATREVKAITLDTIATLLDRHNITDATTQLTIDVNKHTLAGKPAAHILQ